MAETLNDRIEAARSTFENRRLRAGIWAGEAVAGTVLTVVETTRDNPSTGVMLATGAWAIMSASYAALRGLEAVSASSQAAAYEVVQAVHWSELQ